MRLIEGNDTAYIRLLFEEQAQADVEQGACGHVRDARARQVNYRQPSSLGETVSSDTKICKKVIETYHRVPHGVNFSGSLGKLAKFGLLALVRNELCLCRFLRNHEALQCVKPLLQGTKLRADQAFIRKTALEIGVVESIGGESLLCKSHVTENARHRVHVEWPRISSDRTHCHQVQHTLRVELRLMDLEIGHLDIRQSAVYFLVMGNISCRSDTGNRNDTSYLNLDSVCRRT